MTPLKKVREYLYPPTFQEQIETKGWYWLKMVEEAQARKDRQELGPIIDDVPYQVLEPEQKLTDAQSKHEQGGSTHRR